MSQPTSKIILLVGFDPLERARTRAILLAICLRRRQNKRVALFDSEFFFGDLNVHLNIRSVRTSLALAMAGGRF